MKLRNWTILAFLVLSPAALRTCELLGRSPTGYAALLFFGCSVCIGIVGAARRSMALALTSVIASFATLHLSVILIVGPSELKRRLQEPFAEAQTVVSAMLLLGGLILAAAAFAVVLISKKR